MRRLFRRHVRRPLRVGVGVIMTAMAVYILTVNYLASQQRLQRLGTPLTITASLSDSVVNVTLPRRAALTQTQQVASTTPTADHRHDVFPYLRAHAGIKTSVLLAGVPKQRTVYLTIGLATVHRAEEVYYFSTLASLLDKTTTEEKADMTIVTMLADRNQSFNDYILRRLQLQFSAELRAGLVLVIDRPNTEHIFLKPPTRRTYGDSLERVQWRSKQNLDYAALMDFSAGLSEYYLQVEDDVFAAPFYLPKLRQFIQDNQNVSWSRLDVTPNGFIGKLFPCTELPKLVTLLRTFYLEQPCDFLVNFFHLMMGQQKVILRRGKLFFHQGKHSSLRNVTRLVEPAPSSYGDSKVVKELSNHTNPNATVLTSMLVYADHQAEFAYDLQSTAFFWAQDVKRGDFVTVVFSQPQAVKEINIKTGFSVMDRRDAILQARVDVGLKASLPGPMDDPPTRDQPVCTHTRVIGNFSEGSYRHRLTGFTNDIICFSVILTEKQDSWVVIREIVVIV